MWRSLKDRRPEVYKGLDQVDVKAHATLLKALTTTELSPDTTTQPGTPGSS